MNNDCCARQVCISSTDRWGIRWSTALSHPDSVVDSSSYLAIANLKYKINAMQHFNPRTFTKCNHWWSTWWRYAVIETMKHWWRFLDRNVSNCIFDLAAKELSDACLLLFPVQFCPFTVSSCTIVCTCSPLCTLLASWLLCLCSLSATTVTTLSG